MEKAISLIKSIKENIGKVIVGKGEAIELIINALLCKGHVLIEDVPGVGKTILASTLAKSLNLSYKRIQFTPDVLPSDIIGFSMYNIKTAEMEFHPGMIMSHVILADEINRTSPKTQSSLLEAMEEAQVTVDGTTYKVPEPFIVMATQNPIEYIGTFPLPEAQMDRFQVKVSMGYPNKEEEIEILKRFQFENPYDEIEAVVDVQDILYLQQATSMIKVIDIIRDYITSISALTREHKDLSLGASPRGSLYLLRSAQAYALMQGRQYVIPDDVQIMAEPVLCHRLILTPEAKLRGITPSQILKSIIKDLFVPVKIS